MPPACDTRLRPNRGCIVSCYQHGALILTPGGNKEPNRIAWNLYDDWSMLCFTTDRRDVSFSTVIKLWRGHFPAGTETPASFGVHNDRNVHTTSTMSTGAYLQGVKRLGH